MKSGAGTRYLRPTAWPSDGGGAGSVTIPGASITSGSRAEALRPHVQRLEAGRVGSRCGQVRPKVRLGSRPGSSRPQPAPRCSAPAAAAPAAGLRLSARRSVNARSAKTIRRGRRGASRSFGAAAEERGGPNARGGAAHIWAQAARPACTPRPDAVRQESGGGAGTRRDGWLAGGRAGGDIYEAARRGAVARPGFDRPAAAGGGPNANPCGGANKK